MAYSTMDGYYRFYTTRKEHFALEDAPITALDVKSFYNVYKTPTMLFMYAPWCIHCKQFEPIYQQLANACEKEDLPVRFTSVDCEAHPSFINEFNLRGFPTLILFTKNKQYEIYNGNRLLSEVHEWIKKKVA